MAGENPFARLFNKPSSTVQLAVLLPGSRNDELHISITNTDPTATSYDCISYDRSGDKDDVSSINVGGEPMSISRHLETALLQLRDDNKPRTLWADVLAGKSDEERSTQAATSKTIISNADKVIVWLGPATQLSATAFDILQNLSNRWRQACLHSGFPRNIAKSTMQQTMALQTHLMSKSVDDLQGDNKAAWKTVEALLSSTYFKTVQSIPDTLLARDIAVSCGASRMSWEDFVNASKAAAFFMGVRFKMPVSEEFSASLQRILSLDTSCRRKGDGETLELLPMIHAARECSTPDPREIVFSMLPIITPSARQVAGTKKEIPPAADYSRSAGEVFADAAAYIIRERQDLLLWWNESPPRRRKIAGLPSWVPDWTAPLPDGTVKVMPTNVNHMRVWWDHINPTLLKRIKVSDRTLHLQAHVLDRIEGVSSMFTNENCRRLSLDFFQRVKPFPGETVEAKSQRVFRTILLNQAGVGAEIQETAVPPYDMWISYQSMIAEERILELLNCTMQDLMARPELIQRATDPQVAMMAPFLGQSQAFEVLLRKNAIGRCYFTTKGGRTGMTAVQTLPPGHGSNGPVPDFGEAMADPLGRSMLAMFQAHLRERQPEAASAVARALAGDLPGQAPQGARSGDLIAALVGGFQPYILRPENEFADPEANDSRYEFVGDCYLHGVMDAEPFKDSSGKYLREVKLVDITIT